MKGAKIRHETEVVVVALYNSETLTAATFPFNLTAFLKVLGNFAEEMKNHVIDAAGIREATPTPAHIVYCLAVCEEFVRE